MIVRVYGFNARNRPAAIALAAVALSLGAVFLAFGIVLLLGLAAVGTVVGAGALLFRSLTRAGSRRLRRSSADSDLDPALQVFPPEQAAAKPLPGSHADKAQAHKPD